MSEKRHESESEMGFFYVQEFTSVISFELDVSKESFGICFENLGYLAFSANFWVICTNFLRPRTRSYLAMKLKLFFLLICELTSLPFSN